jgi:translation initiation factor IF-1
VKGPSGTRQCIIRFLRDFVKVVGEWGRDLTYEGVFVNIVRHFTSVPGLNLPGRQNWPWTAVSSGKRLKILQFTNISTDSHDLGKSIPQKNTIELEGTVIETLPSAVFRVQLDSGQVILGHLAGKMRIYKIRILPGDKVIIEVTPYDLTRGRIIRRLR